MQSYKKKLICVPFWHNLFLGQEDMEHEFIFPQITQIIFVGKNIFLLFQNYSREYAP